MLDNSFGCATLCTGVKVYGIGFLKCIISTL
jgi:hypothetical protein